MKAWIGKSLIGISLVHIVFGLIIIWDILLVLQNEGLINTVNGQPEREAAFWFMICGLILLILGYIIDWIEKNQIGFPPLLLWLLSIVTLISVLIMPYSGIWLFFIPIGGLILKRRELSSQ